MSSDNTDGTEGNRRRRGILGEILNFASESPDVAAVMTKQVRFL